MLVAIAEMERVPRGEIIVGANEGTCLHILPEVFADFKKQYPDVSVNIKRADYSGILESVIDNSVDFGVVSLPVTDNRLTVVLIHRDELVDHVEQHPDDDDGDEQADDGHDLLSRCEGHAEHEGAEDG